MIYPASPFFVLYGPELLRLTLLPVLAYGQNETGRALQAALGAASPGQSGGQQSR